MVCKSLLEIVGYAGEADCMLLEIEEIVKVKWRASDASIQALGRR